MPTVMPASTILDATGYMYNLDQRREIITQEKAFLEGVLNASSTVAVEAIADAEDQTTSDITEPTT